MIGAMIAAWLDVRSKPLRTLAAIAGMVAAITAVVMVDAASILSRRANEEFIAATYGRTATIAILAAGEADLSRDDPAAPTSLVRALTGNGVTRVSTDVDIGGVLVRGEQRVPTRARWVSSTYPAVSILSITEPTFPVTTATSPSLHAVVSEAVARDLGFDGEEAVGQVVLFRAGPEAANADLSVLGLRPVVIDAVSDPLGVESDDTDVLIVSDIYQKDLAAGRALRWLIHVHPADVGLVLALVQAYGGDSASEETSLNAQRIDRGAELEPLLDQQAVTADVVSVVALLVGGLGVLGVGLASVRERSQDFGLRRALGGNKRMVFLGVIAQTVIEVLAAAALAIPLAAILIRLFARELVLDTLPLPASTVLPVSSAVLGLTGALVVGLLAGLIPAIRASRTSVVVALHG